MAILQSRAKTSNAKWTYGRLVDRLLELGFEPKVNKLDCIALKHSGGAVLLFPKSSRNVPVRPIHLKMAEMALSSYKIGTLEPDRNEVRRKKRLEKLASEIDVIRNEYASLGKSSLAQRLAEARELLHSV